jgi:Mitosis protein DIM1
MMLDLGTGDNNKINWYLDDKQEMIDIIETVYRGARKGKGLVIAPKVCFTNSGLFHKVQVLNTFCCHCITASVINF